MEPAILGLVLDSSVLIAAERRKQTPAQIIEDVVKRVGAVPIILSSLTVAEIGTASIALIRLRSGKAAAFLDELKATIPIHPITEATAEIIARVGGEQAAKGINPPFIDLIIAAGALELGYAIGTGQHPRLYSNSGSQSHFSLAALLRSRINHIQQCPPSRVTGLLLADSHPGCFTCCCEKRLPPRGELLVEWHWT